MISLLVIFNSRFQKNLDSSDIWITSWSGDTQNNCFQIRKRGQHISKSLKNHIALMLAKDPKKRKLIQRCFKLSDSTIRRILKVANSLNFNISKSPSLLSETEELTEQAEEVLRIYIKPPQRPITIEMIKKMIYEQTGEDYGKHCITKFIKNKLKYCFKKGSSRPPQYADDKTQLIKYLYWTEFLSMTLKGDIIINIDESSFDRSLRQNYSWLPKGESNFIINDVYKGKTTLIVGTWNSGQWIEIMTPGTVDSKIFCIFLMILELVVKNLKYNDKEMPIVLLDNAKTHWSNYTKKVWRELIFETRFLPPYWPELAPVEQIFGAVKNKLRRVENFETANFEKEEGIMRICCSLKSLSKEFLLKIWINTINEAKKTVLSFKREVHS